jgi:uncharacterized protein
MLDILVLDILTCLSFFFACHSIMLVFLPYLLLYNACHSIMLVILSCLSFHFSRLSVHHSEKDREFFVELKDGSGVPAKAYLRYAVMNNGLDLRSTVVPPAFEGRGIGKVLARAAFDHCAKNDLKMKLTCWYLDGYLKKHPDEKYTKLVVQ